MGLAPFTTKSDVTKGIAPLVTKAKRERGSGLPAAPFKTF